MEDHPICRVRAAAPPVSQLNIVVLAPQIFNENWVHMVRPYIYVVSLVFEAVRKRCITSVLRGYVFVIALDKLIIVIWWVGAVRDWL